MFPRHGWVGLGLLAGGLIGSSILAYWAAAVVTLAGLTLAMDADTHRRGGSSLFGAHRAYFLALYPTGAIVGWCAEYLNRYIGVWSLFPAPGPGIYLLEVTLAAAALLPAAITARQWLACGWFNASIPSLPALPLGREAQAILLFFLAAVGLMAGTLWPQALYVLGWGAPLALLMSLQRLWNGEAAKEASGARWGAAAAGGHMVGGLLMIVDLLADSPWALEDPFVSASPGAGAVILGLVLFAFYGLVAERVGDWLALGWRTTSKPKRAFPIPIKLESKR